ncbi:hypothetical protein Pdsh_02035 [Pyrodictium delaneyi]|uniref:AAA+ ATPase domain-containing protein n=1 Tax=Pyrodictium delaneyi TaxID=1273541 RepID=A0A211YRE8_9CREN|nr:hypothetical protein Pdsh_02035 [Pyrodictium delaneyi]
MYPEPFTALGEKDRAKLLARWMSLLNASPWLHVAFYLLHEAAWGFEFPRFAIYVRTPVDPSDFGLRAEPSEPPRRPRPVETVVVRSDVPAPSDEDVDEAAGPRTRRVLMPALRLEDGSYARVYVIAKLPAVLPEAVVSEFYGAATEVHMFFQRIEPREAARKLPGMIRRLEALLAMDPSNQELQRRIAKLRMLEQLQAEIASLFRFTAILVVRASSEEELVERSLDLESLAASRRIELYAPRYLQEPLYMLKRSFTTVFRHWLVPRLVTDTISLQAFYPFVSEELMMPGGFLLGRNADTGAPIILNPYGFHNYNVVVIGDSGSGKSMTAKVYIRRYREAYGHPVYIVDPEGEYSKIADVLLPGVPVIDLGGGRPAGLDPVMLAKMEVLDTRQAVAILREMYGIPKELEGTLVKLVMRSSSIFEVYREAGEELRRWLEKAVSLDRWVYEGQPPRGMRSGAVFDLSAVRDRETKVLAGALIASLLSRLLEKRSLLVVDEGWMFSQYPAVMQLLAAVARLGRKRGVNFLFLTQRPQDVLASEHGRTIVENAAVALLLRMNPVALDAVREVLKLSDQEEAFLLDARPGHGILRAENWRLRVYVMPSEEELQLFSTTPGAETGEPVGLTGLEEVEV